MILLDILHDLVKLTIKSYSPFINKSFSLDPSFIIPITISKSVVVTIVVVITVIVIAIATMTSSFPCSSQHPTLMIVVF